MPAPPRQHAGTASQLIPGVRRTVGTLSADVVSYWIGVYGL
jgi:hypothetical protein